MSFKITAGSIPVHRREEDRNHPVGGQPKRLGLNASLSNGLSE